MRGFVTAAPSLKASLWVGLGLAAGIALTTVAKWDTGTKAAACPPGATNMTRLELVFGLARKGRPDVDETEWRDFLAQEVTPRFPDGLSALETQGQWRNATGTIIRERSRLLLIWMKPTAESDSRIEAIRKAWLTKQNQESVIRTESANCVRF